MIAAITLAAKPAWGQYRIQIKVRETVRTAQQLIRFGVSYPMSEPSCCSDSER